MKTSIGADKQIYGGGVITTREDGKISTQFISPAATVLKHRGSVPERSPILTR